MVSVPEVNDFVELTFEGEFENQSPIKGRVAEVTRDSDVIDASLVFVVEDEPGERDVVYSEGVVDGEEWSTVGVRNSKIVLGKNAEWRVLE